MWKIIIKGEAETDYTDLIHLNGIDCQDDFVNYMDNPLKSKMESGYMEFKFEDNKLFTITEYTAKEALTIEEIEELVDYTQGQWSDGIGEDFEQVSCCEINGEEVYISPWFFGQEVTTIQEEIIN